MSTIAIKQPNGLIMMFSSVSSCPVAYNLTREEFIKQYVDLEKDCSYTTPEQSLKDAIQTVDEHIYPWEEFYDRYIPMYREDDDEETQLQRIERKCSEPRIKYCKDIKIKSFDEKRKKYPYVGDRDFNVEDFEHVNNATNNMFQKVIDDYFNECMRVMNTVICDCFRDYLGCKSGEDMCNIISSVQFVKYNEIVDLINERLRDAFSGSGGDLVPQLGGQKEPIPLTEEARKLIIDMWNEVYKEKENESN